LPTKQEIDLEIYPCRIQPAKITSPTGILLFAKQRCVNFYLQQKTSRSPKHTCSCENIHMQPFFSLRKSSFNIKLQARNC